MSDVPVWCRVVVTREQWICFLAPDKDAAMKQAISTPGVVDVLGASYIPPGTQVGIQTADGGSYFGDR